MPKVTDVRDSRKFLEVSDETILKVKAGLYRTDGPTQYLIKKADRKEESTVEILVRVIHETVSVIISTVNSKLVQGRFYIKVLTQPLYISNV